MLYLGGCADEPEGGIHGLRAGETLFDEAPADSEGADGSEPSGSASGGEAEPGTDDEPESDAAEDSASWEMPPEGGDAGWADMVAPDEIICDTWVWQDISRSAHSMASTEQWASDNAFNAAKAAYNTRAERFAEAISCTGKCLNRITHSRIPDKSYVSPKDEAGCHETNTPSAAFPNGPAIWCGKEFKGTEFVMCAEYTTTESELPEETEPSPDEAWKYDETDDPKPTLAPDTKVCSTTSKALNGAGSGLQFSKSESISEATHKANKKLSDAAYDWVATQCPVDDCTNAVTWLTDIDLASPDEAKCSMGNKRTESLTEYQCKNDAHATQHVMCTN